MKEIRIVPLIIGFFLIFLGTSIFVKLLVNIDIPVGRIFWGLALCYFGYYIIMNRCYRHRQYRAGNTWDRIDSCYNNCNSTIMGSATIEVDETAFTNKEPFEYRTTMGNSIIDMTRICPTDGQKTKRIVLIDTIMGKTILKINKNCAFCIHAKVSLSNVKLSDGTIMNSGMRIFCSHPDVSIPDLEIHALTVMGELEIITV